MTNYTCFKAYDIRGRVPDELNETIAYNIGRAFAQFLGAKTVVIGHDIRLTSEAISAAVAKGLQAGGADVLDIGLCGTEEIYFATKHLGVDGGIAITASHNPKDYNGMKFVREGSKPISGDTGLLDIKALAEAAIFTDAQQGSYKQVDTSGAYVEHLLGYIDVAALTPMTIVVNAGNGGAGRVIDLLEPHLPIKFIKVHHQPDGHFPNGVPNPLLEENRASTIAAIKEHGADMGIAWDGDFDRCFFFDESGKFIEGYYIVGMLAQAFLTKQPGSKIVHDPRLTLNTIDICEQQNGVAIQSKTGHAFIKERMRHEDAVYGGEMSAHHYFKDFAYCDSGMIPWLLVVELVQKAGEPLSSFVEAREQKYPVSGEINRKVADASAVIAQVEAMYAPTANDVDKTDGLSISFDRWRFSLRMSNTEPVIRLNVESQGSHSLMIEKRDELLHLIES